MLPCSASSPTIFRTYIAAPRFDHISYRVPYGVRLHLPDRIIEGIGCVHGTQPVEALRYGLAAVLNAISLSDSDWKTEVILRTEYLRQSLDFGRSRKKKKQYGISVRELKTDEALYEETPILADMYCIGIRMADPNNQHECHELSIIEKALENEAWMNPALFEGSEPFHPTFDF